MLFIAALIARGTIAAIATAALMFYLSVNYRADGGKKSHANDGYHYYIRNAHHLPSFLCLPNTESISNLPVFLKTIKVTATAITASHMNSVHHQLPTVYTIEPVI